MPDIDALGLDEIERLKGERNSANFGKEENRREVEKLEAENAALRARAEAAEAERDRLESEVSQAIGSAAYMDPPDGGDVPLAEQVRRIRAERDRMREALEMYAVKPDLHVRGSRGRNGFTCHICAQPGQERDRVAHAPSCLLAEKEPDHGR